MAEGHCIRLVPALYPLLADEQQNTQSDEVKDEKWGGAFVDYFEGTSLTRVLIFQDSDRKEGYRGQLMVQKGSLLVKGIR